MQRTIVFCGPTLASSEVLGRQPAVEASGPAEHGSIYQAVKAGFERIALVDGYFDQRLPVWHKEILFALACGRQVLGAASLGALRAAELDRYGMQGIGTVYRWFRDGAIEDDDEVAVLHEPAERSYRVRSVAMVNLRATFAELLEQGVLSPELVDDLLRIGKRLHYSARTYRQLLAQMASEPQLRDAIEPLSRWLGPRFENGINLKRRDALELLEQLGTDVPAPPKPRFELAQTEAWWEFRRRQDAALDGTPPPAAPR